jgi:hypothetical protein
MRDKRCLRFAALALLAFLPAFPTIAEALPVVFSVGGDNTPASIQATVDAFRGALGAPNNGNALGPLPGGRREINWDGGGAAAPATIFPSPMTTFNSPPPTRGAVFTTPGTGFEISGQPSPRFGEINPTYPDIFGTFSSPRLFTPLGSNITDAFFFVPGTNIPATVSGFGAVFTDVDLSDSTMIEYFDINGSLLFSQFVPEGTVPDQSLSFLGVLFNAGERIFRVRLTSGNVPLGPNDGGLLDAVVIDDLLYSEPQAVPEPSTLLLLGLGLAATGIAALRRRRG